MNLAALELINSERRRSEDITGKVFGKLKVIGKFEPDVRSKNSKWLCICECGREIVFERPNLRRKGIHSCGCSTSQTIKNTFTKHGMTESNAYRAWTDMKTRCLNPKNISYKNYGDRGITIGEYWINSFENFLKDMGNPKSGMSLERLDNDKGYFKENCKWIEKKDQAKNRRNNIYVIFKSKKITVMELWKSTGMKYSYTTFIKYAKRGDEWKLYA